MSRHFSTKFYSSTLPAEDPNLWNWRNIRDSDGRLLRLESRIYVSSNESRQNSPSNIQMENMGYLSGEASSGEPLSEDALLISQNGNAHIPREVPFVAPSDEPGRPWMSDKVRLNASSPAHSFDDDVNDKDFDIDDVVRNDSDSEDHGSELEDDDFEVINQDIKDDQSTDNPKVIILSDLQLKKPNLRLTGESESSRLRKQNLLKTRHIMCVFCEENTISKNFVRHLTRRHSNEKEVQKILRQPLNCKARKQALVSLRKEITFETFLEGKTVPARRNFNDGTEESNAVDYYPCTRCKGLYKKSFLRRHVKLCMVETQTDKISSAVSRSQTFTACQLDQTKAVSRLEVKEKVFDFMRGDDIAFAAKKDLLITYFGDSYLKKHRKEKSVYTCSNKMRELGRLLIECRKLLNDQKIEMQNLLCPSHFDTIVTAARNLAGYDLVKKSFAAPSLALHYGGNLRLLCDELYHLALKDTKGFRSQTPSEKTAFLKDIKKMRQLIISRWNIEMASLANKDLQEKKWNKPLLLPLVSDIKVFREETHKITETSIAAFENDKDTQQDYKTLVECILSSLIIFNRRRIGDVQYMKVSDYKNEQKSNFKDFEDALSTTEKVLATRYRRVLNSGKGSRAVVVLIPEDIDRCIQVLLYHRHKYISEENDYLFSIPGHRVKWGRGDVAIRNLTKRMPLENPAAITSNRLRKQIATVMQILSLSKDDIKQFSNFMGHTVKTHEEFYELPVDVYQTAKVSKMLLMIENGVPVEHKGKSLAEIDIDFKYAEESGMKDLQNYYDDGLRPQEIDEDIMKGESDEEVLQVLAVNKETCTKQHLNGVESSEPSNKANLGQERKKRKKTAVDHAKNNEIGSLMDQEKNEKMEEVSRMKIRKKGKEHEEEDTENSYEVDSEIGEVSRAGNNKMKKDTKKNVAGGGQKRKGWSPKEVSLLQKRFSKCMAKNVYPSTADIRKFLDENNISRDPVSVKSKIQHLMKLKKSKK